MEKATECPLCKRSLMDVKDNNITIIVNGIKFICVCGHELFSRLYNGNYNCENCKMMYEGK